MLLFTVEGNYAYFHIGYVFYITPPWDCFLKIAVALKDSFL